MGREVLGIDIGGSGVKGAIVDLDQGILKSERVRIPTPSNANPQNISEVILYIMDQLNYSGPIGIGVPGPVEDGRVIRAVNLSKDWTNFDARSFFKEKLNVEKLYVLNDADAAAVAEFSFGNWPKVSNTVLFLTIGTGIGSCIVRNGHFIYNTELGHLRFRKKQSFEQFASDRTRKAEELSWKKWGERFNTLLNLYRFYFSEPYFVLGGGVAKKEEKFKMYIQDDIEWQCAQLRNAAGIIGAGIMVDKYGK